MLKNIIQLSHVSLNFTLIRIYKTITNVIQSNFDKRQLKTKKHEEYRKIILLPSLFVNILKASTC